VYIYLTVVFHKFNVYLILILKYILDCLVYIKSLDVKYQYCVHDCIIFVFEFVPDFYQESQGKMCLSDPPGNATAPSVVSMTVLTKGSEWENFLKSYNLQDSGNEAGYLKLLSRDQKPSSNDDFIGRFNVTSVKVCSRLCVRVDGCRAALVDNAGTQCELFDEDEPTLFVDSPGSKYYVLID